MCATKVKIILFKFLARSKILFFLGFDSRTLYNDVAILTLDQQVPFSKGIRPVCLPSAGAGQFSGKYGTVVGWGSLQGLRFFFRILWNYFVALEMGPQSSILQEVMLEIWRNDRCKGTYGSAGKWREEN